MSKKQREKTKSYPSLLLPLLRGGVRRGYSETILK
jgi:hypothetical protein